MHGSSRRNSFVERDSEENSMLSQLSRLPLVSNADVQTSSSQMDQDGNSKESEKPSVETESKSAAQTKTLLPEPRSLHVTHTRHRLPPSAMNLTKEAKATSNSTEEETNGKTARKESSIQPYVFDPITARYPIDDNKKEDKAKTRLHKMTTWLAIMLLLLVLLANRSRIFHLVFIVLFANKSRVCSGDDPEDWFWCF